MESIRLDLLVTEKGIARSREAAKRLIEEGKVTVDGKTVNKPSKLVSPNSILDAQEEKYVSRGAYKLEKALDTFNIDVDDKCFIDCGASTGGFTDCLLQRGASRVIAVDSGLGQLHESLLADPRVKSVEHFNARELDLEVTEGYCNVAVADVSFISQTYIIPPIANVLEDGGIFVSLVKPQFEAGRQALGKNGIVSSAAYRFLAAKRVVNCAVSNGFDCIGFIKSPIEGGDGNKEYLAYFVKRSTVKPTVDDKALKRITSL